MYIPTTTLTQGGGAGALTLILDTTLGAPAASIDTDPTDLSGYTDLIGTIEARFSTATAQGTALVRLNNDSGNNYIRQLGGSSGGSSVAANGSNVSAGWIGDIPGDSATAGQSGAYQFIIFNYLNTTFHKNMYFDGGVRWGSTSHAEESVYNNWASTAAVTRITFLPPSGNFMTGSRLVVYGRA
jgi:hypothetical protein